MFIAGAAASLLKSEQFLSALVLVLAGVAIQVVVHTILPSRRSRRARQALAASGIDADHRARTLTLPIPAGQLQGALPSHFGKSATDRQGAENTVHIAGVPSSHWNPNRIHPMGFNEAIVFVEEIGAESSRVRWEIPSTGEWRTVITMTGAVLAAGILCNLGVEGARTAPYVVPLLVAFGVLFLCLRAVGQRLTTRTWFEERILEAFRQTRSESGTPTPP